MSITLGEVEALKKRSSANKQTSVDHRPYLATELMADTLILILGMLVADRDEDDAFKAELSNGHSENKIGLRGLYSGL